MDKKIKWKKVCGERLVADYAGDHLYCFDLIQDRKHVAEFLKSEDSGWYLNDNSTNLFPLTQINLSLVLAITTKLNKLFPVSL